MDIDFHRHLSAAELISAIDRIEVAIRKRHPSVGRIFWRSTPCALRYKTA